MSSMFQPSREFFYWFILGTVTLLSVSHVHARGGEFAPISGERLPTGMQVTPTAAKGAVIESLNPDLPTRPDYIADHPVKTVISPDGTTMLVLTSGYNRNNDQQGQRVEEESNEYIFVYDISQGKPQKEQVLQVPNTFNGIAWNPNPEYQEFYVSGGVDDNVHTFARDSDGWHEKGVPIALGHDSGLGLDVRPLAAGVAVSQSGNRLLVTNYENDSVSVIDLKDRVVLFELDLRPGKLNPKQASVPGGEYPYAVSIKGDHKAYVTSQRDREIVVLRVQNQDPFLQLGRRIKVKGQPNAMIMNGEQSRLFVASDNSDTVLVIDTDSDKVLEEINTTAPEEVFPNDKEFKGGNPNGLALSADENTLFVTNGGTNSIAVIQLAAGGEENSRVIGLIPTGWYPKSVSVHPDGSMLYAVNAKDNAGPNPHSCRNTLSIEPEALNECRGANHYVWQLHKGGLLSLPVPNARQLAKLTWQVAHNSNFVSADTHQEHQELMRFLRQQINHVIYVVKENRTYDQVLGDLPVGNGDPDLALLSPYSPNHRQWALQFVTLDNFYDSGETSNTGWNWTTAARTTDFTERTAPVNYAGRGLTYDWEGTNRNINMGFATVSQRQQANPFTPDDPDLLPGMADVAAPDNSEGEAGAGYLWDAALRAGLTVRNYGFYGDLSRYFISQDDPNFITMPRMPYADGVVQFYATKPSLHDITDPYFRGYDMKYPDYWRYKEWEREFDQYVRNGKLPNLMLVRLPHDHFGDFETAIDGVNTVETQMADNDYATALLVEKVANSPYKDTTLIAIVEDDAQNGGDHVDAHRSIAYVIGPYVKQAEVVSEHYTTVSLLRTIEDVLGIEPMGLNDGLAAPMVEIFDRHQKEWTYSAIIPAVLYTTDIPLPKRGGPNFAASMIAGANSPKRDAMYWAKAMRGQNFTVEDQLDTPRFNRALWIGLMGQNVPYPSVRHGRDLRDNREELLKTSALSTL